MIKAWMRQSIAKLLGVGSISTTILLPHHALKARSSLLNTRRETAEFIVKAGHHSLRKIV
jgi:hypothetical protein